MTDYVELWAVHLRNAKPRTIKSAVTVVGERDKHLGPRWEFAKISLTAEPAERFDVVVRMDISPELAALRFPEWAILGILDVLMVAEPTPLTGLRITFTDAAYSQIDSSASAFRQAGRDAGRKLVATSMID